MIKGSRMDFVIKLKGEFRGYYAGLYQLHGQSYVGCVDVINDKKVKRCKKRKQQRDLLKRLKVLHHLKKGLVMKI